MTNESPAAPAAQKPYKIQRAAIGANVLVQLLTVAAIVAMVNYVSFRQFKRWDFSRDHKYELSPMTKNLLNSLKEPVKAVIFLPQKRGLAPDVNALLQEYEYASGRKFTVEPVDPYKNLIRAKELADKYKFGGTDNIVILDYKGKSKFVNAQSLADMDNSGAVYGEPETVRSFKGEQAITSALLELTEEKQNKLYCVTGHGEPNVNGDEATAFKAYTERQNVKLAMLNLSNVDVVPADANALLIFGPKADFSEREMKLVADYWNEKKGRLFVLLGPSGKTPRLDAWLTEQGVLPQNDRVLKTGTAYTPDETGQVVVRSGIFPAVGSFTPQGKPVTREVVGQNIQLLGPTQSLKLDPTVAQIKKIKTESLLQALEGYWGETEFALDEGRLVYFDPKKDHIGPLSLAASVEKGGLEDPRVKVDTARMVVAGNGGFLTDDGLRISGEVGINFAMNALNWLLNREQLAGIPPKPKEPVKLNLDERQLGSLAMMVLVTIPGIVAVIGTAVWWQRRH